MNKLTIKELGENFKETHLDKYFNTLFYKIKPSLLLYITNIIHDSNDAEDIYSYTMTTVYNKIDQFDPKWNISTWIHKIALNASLVYLRYKKQEKISSFTSIELYQGAINKIAFFTNDSDGNTFLENEIINEEKTLTIDRYEKVINFITTCGELYTEILVDRFIHDLKYEEIAEKRNLPIHTIRNRIYRGKMKVVENFKHNIK